MKLTEEQRANISQLVFNEVTYQETYLEVYDHMITSLESRDTLPDLQKAYADTLEDDFGGHNGIERMERSRRRLIWKATSHAKMRFFVSFFKWPGIMVPVLFGAFSYYGFKNYDLFLLWLFLGSLVLMVIPFAVMGMGNYIIQVKIKETKKSIENVSIYSMAKRMYTYVLCFVLFDILTKSFHFSMFSFDRHTSRLIGLVVTGSVFFIALIYSISVYKFYYQEFRKRINT